MRTLLDPQNKSRWDKSLSALALLFLLFLFITGCSSSSARSGSGIPLVENGLTVNRAIGEEDLPEEYLLADPSGLAVTDSGDIIVTDENYLKVFTSRGEPNNLLGGKGQGPGKFEGARLPTVSPTGYLSVVDVIFEYNAYGPDLGFLYKQNLRADPELRSFSKNENLTFNMFESVFCLDEERRIIGLFGQNMSVEGKHPVFYYILDYDRGKITLLAKSHSMANVKNENGGGSSSNDLLGEFHWGFINGKEIVYSGTWSDIEEAGEHRSYILHVIDIESHNEREIRVPYEPGETSRYMRELKPFFVKVLNRSVSPNPDLKALMDRQKYFPPFKALRTDGETIFLFKYSLPNTELDKRIELAERAGEEFSGQYEPYDVDVISSTEERLVAKTRFPFIPDVIKMGKAYKIDVMDGFPVIRCAEVNPDLYAARPGFEMRK
jgi:hypothetical protein